VTFTDPALLAAVRRGERAGKSQRVRLRLWHAPDGARVAYREAGTGPRSCCCIRSG